MEGTHSNPGLCRAGEPESRSRSAEWQHFPPPSPSGIQLLGLEISQEVSILFPGVGRLQQLRPGHVDFELGLGGGEEICDDERQLHPDSGEESSGGGPVVVSSSS